MENVICKQFIDYSFLLNKLDMKSCKQCRAQFLVSDREKEFLPKVSPTFAGKKYLIPEPEICPDCRLAARTVHRNEQNFYHGKSSMNSEPLLALYSPDTDWGKNYKIFTHEQWWSDNWDPMEFGKEFDFSRPFFDQFKELSLSIPKVNLIQVDNENCPYTTGTGYCKNCYLINCSENCEDCSYSKLLQGCKNVMDSSYCYDSELCYECFYVTKCYNCTYVYNSQNSSDSWFCDNLKGCSNCFLSTNLANKNYYFMNRQLTKDEYEGRVKTVLDSSEGIKQAKEIFEKMRLERIYKYANVVNCENSTGDFLTNCKNCTDSYDVNDSEDLMYVTVGVNAKDLIDCSNMYLKPQLNYQVLGTIETYNVIFSLYIFNSQDVAYSEFCFNSKNLFGCSGLRNKQYCVFNKQYSQEQYEALVAKIIEHMEKTGEWGKYFPANLSPFGYNETVAQEYIPLTKEAALQREYRWKDPDLREYKKQDFKLPVNISEVTEEILEQTLGCSECRKNYKIIKTELARLKQIGFPIPVNCPSCRHEARMKLRNKRKLWERPCAKCSLTMKTGFEPGRKERVYCDKCYLEEVY